jgi:two-component system, chemotaxis family, protein-glutamate methylesterase/glutaminase
MRKIRILVVDDSIIMRKMLTLLLSKEPDMEVVATARNGEEGVSLARSVQPDAIILDVIMPGMDGLEALTHIRKAAPRLPVIMFSVATAEGAAVTMDALSRGATDFVTKPSQLREAMDAMETISCTLVPKLRAVSSLRRSFPDKTDSAPRKRLFPLGFLARVVAIGVSTGGPEALARFLPGLPADFRCPIAIVQHMPVLFTQHLADRLDKRSSIRVKLAEDGEPLTNGTALLCPGDSHLKISGSVDRPLVRLTDDPPVNSCKPSADILFESVADIFGDRAIGVVLTGMGSDGLQGCHKLHQAGAFILAQDEESSVVWGMPGAIARAGLAHRQLPPEKLAEEVIQAMSRTKHR